MYYQLRDFMPSETFAMNITEHYDEISQCNKCGFCQVACPIFRTTGHESGVARGRLALLRAIIEGRLEWSKEPNPLSIIGY